MEKQKQTGQLAVELGEILAKKRKAVYSTQKEFAEAVTKLTGFPLSPSQVKKIEAGVQMPSLEQYAAILIALGDTPSRREPIGEALLRSSDALGQYVQLQNAKEIAAALRLSYRDTIRLYQSEGEPVPRYIVDFVTAYDAGELDTLQKLEAALDRDHAASLARSIGLAIRFTDLPDQVLDFADKFQRDGTPKEQVISADEVHQAHGQLAKKLPFLASTVPLPGETINTKVRG